MKLDYEERNTKKHDFLYTRRSGSRDIHDTGHDAGETDKSASKRSDAELSFGFSMRLGGESCQGVACTTEDSGDTDSGS